MPAHGRYKICDGLASHPGRSRKTPLASCLMLGVGSGSIDHFAQSLLFHFQQEKEKIVLYIPTGEDLDKKIKNIGLCEALVKFTQ